MLHGDRCVLTTQGGIAGIVVGPAAWERACFNSPEWGGGSSPVKTEPPQIVLLWLLLNGYDYSKTIIIDKRADLSDFFVDFRR